MTESDSEPMQDVKEIAPRTSAGPEERLRALASHIVFDEERSRQSLAEELHSGIGQDIALAKMKIAALRASARGELHEPLRKIELIVEHADRSLHSVTYQLSPPSLHDIGLLPALEWLAENVGGRYGLHVVIVDEASPSVADDRIRVVLFRAVRELLLNVTAHADVSEARITLCSEPGSLLVSVEDEGRGFDVQNVEHLGYGLFGIREQMRQIGGSVKIDSAPGQGTRVSLTAPL